MLSDLFVAQMFGIVDDMNNYDDRKVADKVSLDNGLQISSCYTSDKGYETAIGYKDDWNKVEQEVNNLTEWQKRRLDNMFAELVELEEILIKTGVIL